MQQVKASVVLLREVDVGNHHQDLDDGAEVFSDGVMKRRVSIRVLAEADCQIALVRVLVFLEVVKCKTNTKRI